MSDNFGVTPARSFITTCSTRTYAVPGHRKPTLYIREVPESVAQTLKERAAAQGKSLSAYVGAELARIAARPTNEEVAARLRARDRSTGPSADEIVAAVEAGRR